MTRYTIIRQDGKAYVDGEAHSVDTSDLPTFIHAIQWDGNKGHIEFGPDEKGVQHGNMVLNDFSLYQVYVDRWKESKEKHEKEIADREKKKEEQRVEFARQAEESQKRKATRKVR